MKGRTLEARVGDAIRERREASGTSQEAFADDIGMHRTYYGEIERGKNLTLRTFARVCAGLKAKMWEVLRDADL